MKKKLILIILMSLLISGCNQINDENMDIANNAETSTINTTTENINIETSTLDITTEKIESDITVLETAYTQEAEKEKILNAINNIDLDYIFSLKPEQLTNNFENAHVSKMNNNILIYPDKSFKQISIYIDDIYIHYFYFDDFGKLAGIEFFDTGKILKNGKTKNNFDEIQEILGKTDLLYVENENTFSNAVLPYDFNNYSYLFYSDKIDGENCTVLICKKEDKYLGKTSKIERNFRNDLPDIIISKKDEIFSFFEKNPFDDYEIIDNYIIIGEAKGDLNNDKKDDFAVVVQQENTYKLWGDELRQIYIFEQNENGTYKLSHINKNLILNSNEGGPFGDPFGGISIENNLLYSKDIGGSSERWSNEYYFGYDNNEFILKKYISDGFSTYNGNGEAFIYDFENFSCTQEIYGENIPNGSKIIFQTPIKESRIYFDKFKYDDLRSDELYIYTPAFRDYKFYDTYSDLTISAEQALDIVKNSYYNNMEKFYITWTEETKKNYSEALGYEPPDYYYTDENEAVLYYYFIDTEEEIKHAIFYNDKNNHRNSKLYYVSDSSGEILN